VAVIQLPLQAMVQDRTANHQRTVLRHRRLQTAHLFPEQRIHSASLALAAASRDLLALAAMIEPAWAVPSQDTYQRPPEGHAKLPNAWALLGGPEYGS
jgi:hypothetical protein